METSSISGSNPSKPVKPSSSTPPAHSSEGPKPLPSAEAQEKRLEAEKNRLDKVA